MYRIKKSSGLLRRPSLGRHRQAGVTVLELIAVGAFTGTLAFTALSVAQTWPSRLDLQDSATQAMLLISKARLEAIQRGVTTVVEADLEAGVLRAYADVNGDTLAASAGHAHYLKYDPDWRDGAYEPEIGIRSTDYEIGRLILGKSIFAAPADGEPVTGFTAIPGAPAGTPRVLVFATTGVPASAGAFRLADRTGIDGEPRNFFETAVTSLTGKVAVRKYLLPQDFAHRRSRLLPPGEEGDR